MSLYNNVADSLAGKGIFGAIESAVGGAIGGVVDSAVGGIVGSAGVGLGGAMVIGAIGESVKSMATDAVMGEINSHIPGNYRNAIETGSRAIGNIMNGNIEGAMNDIVGGGLLDGIFKGSSGFLSQAAYRGKPTPLFGGLSPADAKKIYMDSIATKFARKNLFLIEVESKLGGNFGDVFNLFVVDLDYPPFQVQADKKRVGGATIDVVQGHEPVTLRFTTMDNANGDIKKWFAKHFSATAARDGTVGVPADYAIKFKIVHGIIKKGFMSSGSYEDIGLFRTESLESQLSRREDGLEELSLSFSQVDSYKKP